LGVWGTEISTIFGPLKKYLAGKRFPRDADVKQVITWLQTLDIDFLYAGIQALAQLWDRCVNVNGDYVEV
jgi:hypothetical protein